MPWISAVEAAERLARLRTSSATTAKPRPCSPARAASMAALRGPQVGLLRDAADGVEDAADGIGLARQGLDDPGHLLDLTG